MKPLPLTDGDFLLVGKLPHISFFSAQAAEVTNGTGPFPSFAIRVSLERLAAGLVLVDAQRKIPDLTHKSRSVHIAWAVRSQASVIPRLLVLVCVQPQSGTSLTCDALLAYIRYARSYV